MRRMWASLCGWLLLSVLLVGVPPAALPAEAAALAKISVAPSKPIKSEQFTVTGTLGTTIVRPVMLQAKSGSRWKTLSTGNTDALGKFTLTASTKAKSVKVRALAPPVVVNGSSFAQVTSRTVTVRTVGQKAKLSLPKKATVGTSVTAKLSVTPGRSGRPVEVQVKQAGSWVKVAAGTQSASGKAKLTFTPTTAGKLRYRAYAPAWHGAAAVTSGQSKVTVKAGALKIATTSLADAVRGQPYTAKLIASGGTAPYTWAATGLPAGLGLNASSGAISGAATTAGKYAVKITVTDSARHTATASLAFTVKAANRAVALQVGAGSSHTCAVTDAGTIMCWGDDWFGQLGDGKSGLGVNSTTPVQVKGLVGAATAVAPGYSYTCAITGGGRVQCWGADGGTLGDPENHQETGYLSTVPVQVSGLTSGVKAITAGAYRACAITSGGGVVCWGSDNRGSLGDVEEHKDFESQVPVQVAGLTSGVKAIDSGEWHTCAVVASGGVVCWGDNQEGQLGNGTTDLATTPVAVKGLASGVTAIAAGATSTCALTTAGRVKCWGAGVAETSGVAGFESSLVPVEVPGLTGVKAIAVGWYHACALSADGTVKCWGTSELLGAEFATSPIYPLVQAAGVTGATGLSIGDFHTCALVQAGSLKCWGGNVSGELGIGKVSAQELLPVDVIGFS